MVVLGVGLSNDVDNMSNPNRGASYFANAIKNVQPLDDVIYSPRTKSSIDLESLDKISGKALKIINRGDRLGANLSAYIAQIILGDVAGCFIRHIESDRVFKDSIFIRALNSLIDDINKNREDSLEEVVLFEHSCRVLSSKCCLGAKQDICSYFREHYLENFNKHLERYAQEVGYNCPHNWENTTCVHLRLDDVSQRPICSGKDSFRYHKEKINKGDLNFKDKKEYFQKLNLPWPYYAYDQQAPMDKKTISNMINKCRKLFPEHKVVVVASPTGGHIDLVVDKVIRTSDESFDLYCLMNAAVLVGSKSTYATCAAFFQKGSVVFLPKWGMSAATGLKSKYDKSNIAVF